MNEGLAIPVRLNGKVEDFVTEPEGYEFVVTPVGIVPVERVPDNLSEVTKPLLAKDKPKA